MIEIHQPEIEALIQQRLDSGAFRDVEEVLIHALKSAPLPKTTAGEASADALITPGEELVVAMQSMPHKNIEISNGGLSRVEDRHVEARKSSLSCEEEPARELNLVEVCAMVRGLADDLDLTRNPSVGRPVDLS